MSKEPRRIPVSSRAAIQRINRKLAPEDRVLKTSRGAKAQSDFGQYYILDSDRNLIVDDHVDLEYFGQKLGAIAAWETVVDE